VLHELGRHSPFESALRAVIGLEGIGLQERLPFDGLQLLSRAGLLGMRPAPASAIECLIESCFGVRARVEQFLPSWYSVEESDRTRLGLVNSTLGADVNLGSEVCLSQSRFRIRLGPMDLDLYRALLPDRPAFTTLNSLVRLASGPDFDFDFSLILRGSAVPSLRLGGSPDDAEEPACRLGWSSWLKTRPFEHDVDDAVFTPSLEREERGDLLEMRA
jgi:type VI secretion system protein ImpH